MGSKAYRPAVVTGAASHLGAFLIGTAAGLLGAGVIGVGVLGPEAVAERNEAGHTCDDPRCDLCAANREWAEANPGRRPGDLADDETIAAMPVRYFDDDAGAD
jgi:NAD(P)-dependent dehydrogenase (short-subunit alcohol dehydrogenase family)